MVTEMPSCFWTSAKNKKPHSLRKSRAVVHLLSWFALLLLIQTQQGAAQVWLQSLHMDSLQPLGSLLDRELDLLILLQGAESIALDGGVMDKYVLCVLTGDESISFGIIEPFDGSGLFFSHFSYSLIGVNLVKQ